MPACQQAAKEGLVLGMFDSHKLYGADSAKVSSALEQKIVSEIKALGNKGTPGEVQLVFNEDLTKQIAVVGLGSEESLKANKTEIVRTAVANGIKKLQASNVTKVSIASMPCQHASGEAAALALYKFDAFKTAKGNEDKGQVTVAHLSSEACGSDAAHGWETGKVYAEAQNLARDLANTPANFMTPTIFANRVKRDLEAFDSVEVNIYDQSWAESQRMGGLIAVSKGSDEPLRFLEIIYKGAPESGEIPLAMVGKGITFDTGGYSLKLGKHMDLMKGDMGGAAAVVSAMRAIAQLKLPINIVATTPLCENMISGRATKVSDVYTSRAGLTVEVMNTDAEGRIVLADALHYTVETHKPKALVDVATLTGAMVVALGEFYTGVFTPSPALWQTIETASKKTDEAVWRMPLHDVWDSMLKSPVADLSNIGNKAEAGSCTAAAFLRQFVHGPRLPKLPKILGEQNSDETLPRWAHLDIAGPMETTSSAGYHHPGMSGRPVRLLIELAHQLAKNPLP
ncbi:hypothetical protein GGI12_000178 [Dipsacomyces acuminosporus]|nr:hypothetical protein GGI12_000178 [Dipsacomyces acuminosporus]